MRGEPVAMLNMLCSPLVHPQLSCRVVSCRVVLLSYQNDAMAQRYGGGGEEGEFPCGPLAH
jgi:hypothetical protein